MVFRISSCHFLKHVFIFEQVVVQSQWPRGLGRWSWPLGYSDIRFEFRLSHGCLSLSFCVVLSCIDRGFATGRLSVQGVLPSVEEQGSETLRRGGRCTTSTHRKKVKVVSGLLKLFQVAGKQQTHSDTSVRMLVDTLWLL